MRIFFLFFLCVLFGTTTWSQTLAMQRLPHGIELEGDTLSFEQEGQALRASGNVIVSYDHYLLHTEQLSYQAASGLISIPTPLTLHIQGHTIQAAHLNYNLKTYQGGASGLNAGVAGMVIRGDRIHFGTDKVTVYNAYFTSCDKDSPNHYWVTANKLLIYPQWGYIILFKGGFHSDYLPFSLPIPTYIYGSKQYGLKGTRSLVPDIGSNKIEGFYVKSALGYFLSPRTSGSVLLGYSGNLGLLFGISQGHEINSSQKTAFRIQSSGSDGLEGHIRYDIDFAKRDKPQPIGVLEEVLENFIEDNDKPLSRVSLLFQHHEIIQDVRVSYTPLLTFESNNLKLKYDKYELSTLANFGKVSELRDDLRRNNFPREQWTFQSWRSNLNPTLTRTDQLTQTMRLKSDLTFKGYWYDTGQTWQRLFSTLGLQWDLPGIRTEWSYTKLLIPVIGETPFLFEQQYAIESDELGFGFEKDFTHFDLSGKHFYGLNTHETRILDLTLGLKFHCFRFGFTWKLKQNAFTFGVDIY